MQPQGSGAQLPQGGIVVGGHGSRQTLFREILSGPFLPIER